MRAWLTAEGANAGLPGAVTFGRAAASASRLGCATVVAAGCATTVAGRAGGFCGDCAKTMVVGSIENRKNGMNNFFMGQMDLTTSKIENSRLGSK